MRRRTDPGSGRSASRSSRRRGRAAARGPWSAWPARDAWSCRGIRNRAGACALLRSPLMRARRALCQFPLVAEQVLEVVVAPLRGRGGPGDLQAAGDRVTAHARAEGAPPAQPLLLETATFGLRPHIGLEAGAVGLAEGVAAGDERHRLLVVHGHARESLADIPGRRDRVWIAVRALRVDIDQPHLNGAERILEIPVAGVTLVTQPLVLR